MTHPIPNAALDDRLAFVGNTGSGKTYAAGTAVERLLTSGARVVIPDPLGVWWGLALEADGKTPSSFRKDEKLVIFGGPRGDLALTEYSGALIGETVAGMAESCILDLSELRGKAAERRFMLAFLEALYRHKTNEPLHVVFDEADMWSPQRILDKEGEAMKLLGMMETICRRGRVKGFIPWLISQRPAVISKNVLSQIDGMVALKLTSVQDRDAIGDWVEGQADTGQWKAMWADMATLERGQGVVWLPARGILKTVAFPQKTTFDSSRAPKRGERMTSAKALTPVNLDKLKQRLATVEVESKANDPRALRSSNVEKDRRIKQLEDELTSKSTTPAKGGKPDKDALAAAEKNGFEQAERKLKRAMERAANAKIMRHLEGLHTIIAPIDAGLKIAIENARKEKIVLDTPEFTPSPSSTIPQPRPPMQKTTLVQRAATVPRETEGDGAIGGVAQKILDSVAEMEALCNEPPARSLVAIMSGYKNVKSAGFAKALSSLSASGHVSYPNAGTVVITDSGRALAAPASRPHTSREVQQRVISIMGQTAGRILSELIAIYPNAIDREELARRSGYQNVKSAGFAKSLSRMSALGFVDYPSARQAVAGDILFPEKAAA